MIPDAEYLVIHHLNSHSAVEDLGVQVYGQTPKDKSAGWIRVSSLDEIQEDAADYFVNCMLQVDCYASEAGLQGSQQRHVALIARTVRAALQDIQGLHEGIGVAGRPWVTGGPRLLDTDIEPARERKILTVQLPVHP